MLKVTTVLVSGLFCITSVYGGGDQEGESPSRFTRIGQKFSILGRVFKKDQQNTSTTAVSTPAKDMSPSGETLYWSEKGQRSEEQQKIDEEEQQKRKQEISKKLEEERRLQQEQMERYRKEVDEKRRRIKQELTQDDFQSPALVDVLSKRWLMARMKSRYHRKVFLAIGNAESEYNEESLHELRKLLKFLQSEKFRIVYDADSGAAKWIERLVDPEWRLGISGRKEMRSEDVLVIQNPYMRMETLLSLETFIISPDSILGLGLLMEGHNRSDTHFKILDLDQKWNPGLTEWRHYLETTYVSDEKSEEVKEEKEKAQVETIEKEKEREKEKEEEGKGQENLGEKSELDLRNKSGSKVKAFFKRLAWEFMVGGPFPYYYDQSDYYSSSDVGRSSTSHFFSYKRTINLGIIYEHHKDPMVFNNARALNRHIDYIHNYNLSLSHYKRYALKFPKINLETEVDRLESKEVIEDLDWARMYRDKAYSVEINPATNSKIDPGVVFFGSSKMDSGDYKKTVKEVIQVIAAHRLSVATGGSGGLMRVANRTAYKNGVYSIGIPLGGHQLEFERFIFKNDHHLTVQTPGYEVRIPLLLQNRHMILIAPGGMGTMQELATALVKVSAEKSLGLSPCFIFIGKNYYEKLTDWIRGLNLPYSFINKIFLVNSGEEMENIFKQS